MDRLVFIDATMREESRTRRIALPIISELSGRYDIETIRLDGAGFPVVNGRILHDRDCGIVPVEYADMSRRIAAADRIVIAAPFWDMSFPSALKVFFENMSLFHITFEHSVDYGGIAYVNLRSICKAVPEMRCKIAYGLASGTDHGRYLRDRERMGSGLPGTGLSASRRQKDSNGGNGGEKAPYIIVNCHIIYYFI